MNQHEFVPLEMSSTEERWLIGFAEGDGSIGVHARGLPFIAFGQKDCSIINYIHQLIKRGTISKDKYDFYRLTVNGINDCFPLVETYSKQVVSTHTSERLNKLLELYELPQAERHLPTIEWLAGFFDAEGSSSSIPDINIGQKELQVLEDIKNVFGGKVFPIHTNNYDGYVWKLYNSTALPLLKQISVYSHNPTKVATALQHFNGPSYRETHKNEKREYDAQNHVGQQKSYLKNRVKILERKHEQTVKNREARKYFKEHPEEEAKLHAKP